MKCFVLAWAALALGLSGSPIAAQQAHGGPTSDIETRYLQSVPPAPPPPRSHSVAHKPPPFPPMPRAEPKHRSTKAATHSSRTTTKAKTKATSKRHIASAKRHLAASKHKPASSKRQAAKSKVKQAASASPAKLHLSPKTIRQCHAMSYSRMMGHRYCRALMKQEIAAADAKHATAKKKAPAKRTKTKRSRRR